MKSSPFSSIITKMNGGNYEMWAMQVKRTLIAHDKEHLILEPEPVQKTDKYTTWFKDNSLVMVWIVGTLSQEIANEVLHKESAKDMWDSLAATYSQARNETRIMQLHHDIHQMRQDGRPLHTNYSSLKSMFERLNSYFLACKCEQQKTYRDMLMVGVFLSGLDSVYESAKNQILTSPSIPPIDEAYSRLSRIPISASTVPDTTSAMLATRGRGGPFFARGRGGRGRGSTTSRPLRNLIGDRIQQAPDPTTSAITTAASASSSGMSSSPATDTTDWLIDSGTQNTLLATIHPGKNSPHIISSRFSQDQGLNIGRNRTDNPNFHLTIFQRPGRPLWISFGGRRSLPGDIVQATTTGYSDFEGSRPREIVILVQPDGSDMNRQVLTLGIAARVQGIVNLGDHCVSHSNQQEQERRTHKRQRESKIQSATTLGKERRRWSQRRHWR
ncbi:hypothetical protein EJ110_NYTH45844 [Nymphaea thermarum]|nr:hypothetical protein EJ110_NYTH45844 [Nymphaea thermarum]